MLITGGPRSPEKALALRLFQQFDCAPAGRAGFHEAKLPGAIHHS